MRSLINLINIVQLEFPTLRRLVGTQGKYLVRDDYKVVVCLDVRDSFWWLESDEQFESSRWLKNGARVFDLDAVRLSDLCCLSPQQNFWSSSEDNLFSLISSMDIGALEASSGQVIHTSLPKASSLWQVVDMTLKQLGWLWGNLNELLKQHQCSQTKGWFTLHCKSAATCDKQLHFWREIGNFLSLQHHSPLGHCRNLQLVRTSLKGCQLWRILHW